MTSHSKTIKLELTPAELLALYDEVEEAFLFSDDPNFESTWHKIQDAFNCHAFTITSTSNMQFNTHVTDRDLIDDESLHEEKDE